MNKAQWRKSMEKAIGKVPGVSNVIVFGDGIEEGYRFALPGGRQMSDSFLVSGHEYVNVIARERLLAKVRVIGDKLAATRMEEIR
jgi:hypothetical protein